MKTTQEIIEIMKQAHDAMLEYEKAIQSGKNVNWNRGAAVCDAPPEPSITE